jgi:choline dehydrogenase-like flavoprotein
MAVLANPDTVRPTDEIVDVLIIGAGASGAAVAWSLAETRMKILCLEQGDWIKSTEFPSNGRDWEARRYTDFDISPNRRGRDTDYPINDDNSARVYRTLLYHRLLVGVACEDLPEEHNRVTLDPVLKDSHDIPAPRIDYTISENTRRMMEHGIARASEILATAGAKNISCSRTVLNYPGHLLGTARMGLDPERSVVNEWGRCHDVKNLFIVDGSIWVTSGGVNPTSTIQALALYIADNIKQRLATLFD